MANGQDFSSLGQALQIFQTGTRRLQMDRVLNQANEAISQVRASEANEADQRKALRAISEQFTQQAVTTGAIEIPEAQSFREALAPEPGFEERVQIQTQAQERSVQRQARRQQETGFPQSFKEVKEARTRAVRVDGETFFAVSPKAAKTFTTSQNAAAVGQRSIDRLLDINKQLSKLGPLDLVNPIPGSKGAELKREAGSIKTLLVGALNKVVTGGGPLRSEEVERIEGILGDVGTATSFSEANITRLNAVSDTLRALPEQARQAAGLSRSPSAFGGDARTRRELQQEGIDKRRQNLRGTAKSRFER